jgi:hypothetical protein
MEPSVSVLYKGSLAHFAVSKSNNGIYNVHLLKYLGHLVNEPPQKFTLFKEGRHWSNDNVNQDLLDDVGFAIEFLQSKRG